MSQTFHLPDLGEGVHEGQVLKILVPAGDPVALDQPIMEVETDKAAVVGKHHAVGLGDVGHARAGGVQRGKQGDRVAGQVDVNHVAGLDCPTDGGVRLDAHQAAEREATHEHPRRREDGADSLDLVGAPSAIPPTGHQGDVMASRSQFVGLVECHSQGPAHAGAGPCRC